MSIPRSIRRCFFRPAMLLSLAALPVAAQLAERSSPLQSLKKLSVAELMEVEVVSVSRRAEKLSDVASAIQTITTDEIAASGATSLPEALRLASNLQVAQANTSQWAISSRGFNNVLANKLLVMIDGRTVYTPLYAGVFWDVQTVFLPDVERIEVVSGPGGALWGANAVNGVINVISKTAKDTQGLYLEAGAGNVERGFGGFRYGGQLAPNLYYRIYTTTSYPDSTFSINGSDAQDDWNMTQGGMRIDWEPTREDAVAVHADVYKGEPDPDGGAPVLAEGGNVVAKWTRVLSEESDFQVQAYYDRTTRDFRNGFKEFLTTLDLDWQHRLTPIPNNELIWGLGVRSMDHTVENLPLFGFFPATKALHLYSGFVQEEVRWAEDRLRFTVGTKLEHNDFTGFEFQPSARLAWHASDQHTVWTAISRAVRTPARIDQDFLLEAAPNFPVIQGSDDFKSETVVAYELGWRARIAERITASVSTFYNVYDDLRSAEPGPAPLNLPIQFANGVEGTGYGAELSASYTVSEMLRLRVGYTFLQKNLEIKSSSHDLNGGTAESDDPKHQASFQVISRPVKDVELGAVVRYVSALPNPRVSAYTSLDLRLAWMPTRTVEFALVGQNLLTPRHLEFAPTSPGAREIPRSVYGKVTMAY